MWCCICDKNIYSTVYIQVFQRYFEIVPRKFSLQAPSRQWHSYGRAGGTTHWGGVKAGVPSCFAPPLAVHHFEMPTAFLHFLPFEKKEKQKKWVAHYCSGCLWRGAGEGAAVMRRYYKEFLLLYLLHHSTFSMLVLGVVASRSDQSTVSTTPQYFLRKIVKKAVSWSEWHITTPSVAITQK